MNYVATVNVHYRKMEIYLVPIGKGSRRIFILSLCLGLKGPFTFRLNQEEICTTATYDTSLVKYLFGSGKS